MPLNIKRGKNVDFQTKKSVTSTPEAKFIWKLEAVLKYLSQF